MSSIIRDTQALMVSKTLLDMAQEYNTYTYRRLGDRTVRLFVGKCAYDVVFNVVNIEVYSSRGMRNFSYYTADECAKDILDFIKTDAAKDLL